MGRQQFSASCRSVVFGVTLAGVLGTAIGVDAQALKDLQTPDTPLVLKAQGSFFVGGEKVEQTKVELGDLGPGGHITVNQMYVRYMVPQGGDGNVPVVMVHGATLTGKSWETTPDGRMGWDEYFVRKGHPVYVPDQVGPRAIGIQSGRLQRRARGVGAACQSPALAAIQRRGRLAELPLRSRTWPALTRTAVSGDRPRRAREAGRAGRQFRRPAHAEPDVQGVVGSRRSIEWRGVDGPLAVRVRFRWKPRCSIPPRPKVSCSSSPAAAPTPTLTNRSRRWRRFRCWSSSAITATRRQASRFDPRGSCPSRAVRRSSAASRRPAVRRRCSARRDRHPRQQPHDHAGQEQPADRRSDPAVDRRARQQAEGANEARRRAMARHWCRPVVVVARLLAVQPQPPRLALQLRGLCRAADHGGQHQRRTRARSSPGSTTCATSLAAAASS